MNRKSENRGLVSSATSATPPPHLRQEVERMARDDTAAATVPMVACSACGHMVPEWNLTIHQARACPGNAPRVAMSADHSAMDHSNEHEQENNHIHHDDDDDDDFMEVYDASDHHHPVDSSATAVATAPPSTWDNTTATPGVPLAASARNVIDLTSPDNEIEEQWTCQRCTLFNDITDRYCAACGEMRPRQRRRQQPYMGGDDDDDCRTPDPIRREQLIPDMQWQTQSSNVSSSAPSPVFVGGGALVGGMLGAAGAYFRGQPMSSAMLEGAVTGAVGAAVAQQAWQQTTPPRLARASNVRLPNDRVAASRSSATMGMPVYPAATAHPNNSNNNNNQARPRSSMRVVTHVTQNGTTRTTVMEQGRSRTTVRTRANNNNVDTDADALLAAVQQFLAFSPLMMPPGTQPHNNMNIDGMSYDQLLDAFGDGTEGRRGASEATIHSLPTQVLQQDPPKEWSNNPELQTCSICLDPYQKGQSRKCLPCLHGFHQHCIDPWLRSNASCPICKHQLS